MGFQGFLSGRGERGRWFAAPRHGHRLSRAPKAAETDRLATFFERQRELLRRDAEAEGRIAPFVPPGEDAIEVAAWTGVARGLMNLDEFITRE
jgi:hypothetical protein